MSEAVSTGREKRLEGGRLFGTRPVVPFWAEEPVKALYGILLFALNLHQNL